MPKRLKRQSGLRPNTLESRVTQQFERINDRRFNLALTTLRDGVLWDRIGHSILQEFISLGLSQSQEDKLLEKMRRDLAFPTQLPQGTRKVDPYTIALVLIDIYRAQGRSPKVEHFLADYFSKGPYGDHRAYEAYRRLAIGYLGKFIDVDLYDFAALIVSAHSPTKENSSPISLGVNLGQLLHEVKVIQGEKIRILFYDARFIKALNEKGMLDAYLASSLDEAGHLNENIYKTFPDLLNSPFEQALMEKGAKRPVVEPHKPLQ